jgi:hypothetical protein
MCVGWMTQALNGKRAYRRIYPWPRLPYPSQQKAPGSETRGFLRVAPTPSNRDHLPTEFIVDPELRHLDVAVAAGESIAGEDDARTSKCLATQAQKIVLDLRRPIVRESPLDAPAHQPAAVGVVVVVVVGAADRCAGRDVGDGEAVAANPAAASLAVDEPSVKCHAKPTSHRRDPSIIGRLLESSNARNNNPSTRIIVVRSPVEVPFHAENVVAELVVEPDLAAADEYAVVASVVEVNAEEAVGHVTVGPCASQVTADIKPGPCEGRRHIGRGGGGTCTTGACYSRRTAAADNQRVSTIRRRPAGNAIEKPRDAAQAVSYRKVSRREARQFTVFFWSQGSNSPATLRWGLVLIPLPECRETGE